MIYGKYIEFDFIIKELKNYQLVLNEKVKEYYRVPVNNK